LRIANLFGGAPKRDQFYDARMAQVIVATPGRLRDYLSSGNPDKLKNVQSLILDEADRMLDMGFE
jgi:ATP-independent RNA helicase DbpA